LKLFRNIESFFQKHIEGFFDKTFGSGIQPVELAKSLVKYMENERSVGVSHVYVPNRYVVYLGSEDFNRLQTYQQNIEKELTGYLQQPIFKPAVRLNGRLTVVEGLDTGQRVEAAVNRINIGRRESNEMPLSDMNTSRLHAYVIYEEGAHVLYDAKSLNGTYVNDHRVTRKRLKNKDRIKLGSTVLLYEVK